MKLEAIDHIKSLNMQELPSDIRDGADNTFDSEEKKLIIFHILTLHVTQQ